MIPWPWPPPADDGGAQHLIGGLELPDLALPTTSGKTISLRQLPGRTVLFAYTWTGRPGVDNPPDWDTIPGAHGSTPQLQGVRNLLSSFASLDTRVLGISTQPTAWQRELAERLELPFDLISDETLAFARALRLPAFETGGQVYLKRLTLMIENGRINYVFYPAHPPDVHPREALAWLTDAVGYALESRLN
jgi:peroxiredoxin